MEGKEAHSLQDDDVSKDVRKGMKGQRRLQIMNHSLF